MKNRILILIGIVFFLPLFCGLGFIYYLENASDKVIYKENKQMLLNDINLSPELPQSFYDTVTKYYPGMEGAHFWKALFYETVWGEQIKCPCKELYFHSYIDKRARFASQIVSLYLEEVVSNKDCFKFEMANIYFDDNTRGVTAAAKRFYNKDLKDLTAEQMIALTIIPLGPNRYHPSRNKELLEKAVAIRMNKHK